jgi:hypothetical protein
MSAMQTTPTRTHPHWLFMAVLGFAVLEVLGGLLFTAAVVHGGVIALTAFMAGVVVSLSLWWWTSNEAGRGVAHVAARLSFCAVGGLAFYSNVTYVLWAAGVPLDLGIVRDGRMGEHFWLGPFTLAYAVFAFVVLKRRPR